MAKTPERPPWSERRVTSVNLSLAARDRLEQVVRLLKIQHDIRVSRSDLVDAIVRGWSLEELATAVVRIRDQDMAASDAWDRSGDG